MQEVHPTDSDRTRRFEERILPHLDASYNLARWLLHSDEGAEDVVQEAFLRAYRFFDGYRGGDSRAWLLTIVRNTCYSWLRRHRVGDLLDSLDDELHPDEDVASNPEKLLERLNVEQSVKRALEKLPADFREVIVLRELEGLSYKEIAECANLPIGTVMSRLARARRQLHKYLAGEQKGSVHHEL